EFQFQRIVTTSRGCATSGLLLAGDRLCRALAGPRVRMRALAANRQTAAMAETAIAAEVHEALDVHRHFAAQVALDDIVTVDGLADLQDLRVGELIHPPLRRNTNLLADFLREFRTNAMNVLERDDNALLRRNIYASDTGHVSLLASLRSLLCHPTA